MRRVRKLKGKAAVAMSGVLVAMVSASAIADETTDRILRQLGLSGEDSSSSHSVSRSDDRGTVAVDLKDLSAEDLPFPPPDREKSLLAREQRIAPALQILGQTSDWYKDIDGLREKALELNVPVSGRDVAVAFSTYDESELEADLADLGGRVTYSYGDVVYAEVPADSLSELKDISAFDYASPQQMLKPAFLDSKGEVVSEGVEAIRVKRLHDAGLRGKGIKVGILDFGFERYNELVERGELPAAAAARAFNQAGEVESGGVHGTACAEIIHDVAPEAELYIAGVDGRPDQIMEAAKWLAEEQEVDIISFSGGTPIGSKRGNALLDQFIDEMVEDRNLLWVNAAGNEGQKHWSGDARDPDGNGILNIEADKELFVLEKPREGGLSVTAIWDDWGADPSLPASTQDIDAYLFVYRDGEAHLIAKSENPQRGRGAPLEYIAGKAPAGTYLVALKATSLKESVKLRLIVEGAGMSPVNPVGSIGIPATAQSALAVGAVDVRTEKLAPYSSQGPTDDGRLKPEVSAPDNNTSVSYDQQGGRFPGTSAACPHVSGFAALLKQLRPKTDREQLAALVIENVRPMGKTHPNNAYGHGHVDAGDVAVDGGDGDGASSEESGDEDEMIRRLQGILSR